MYLKFSAMWDRVILKPVLKFCKIFGTTYSSLVTSVTTQNL